MEGTKKVARGIINAPLQLKTTTQFRHCFSPCNKGLILSRKFTALTPDPVKRYRVSIKMLPSDV